MRVQHKDGDDMFSFRILYDLSAEIQRTAMEIRIANSYDDAYANWKATHDPLFALQKNGILSRNSYKVYSNMLERAMTD